MRNELMDWLDAVYEAGSISAAARRMGFSYRHAWGVLKRFEEHLGAPLIVWEKGQKARLSPFGDKLRWAERQAQAHLAPQISALQAELERTFAMAFDPESHLLTLYASHDDALLGLREVSASQRLHLDVRFCGSVDAIRALNEGRCTVAGFHAPLHPRADSLVARTYRPLLKTGQHKLIGFALRTQGLMVASGNPLGLAGLSDLVRTGARYVNRALGTGTRLLLDEWLLASGQSPAGLKGYEQEESSHAAVAARIASGQADAGLGIASAAHARRLDFVPLIREAYWLVCLKEALETPQVSQLRTVLQGPDWAERLRQWPGYEPAPGAGQVHALRQTLPWWASNH